MKVSGTRLNRLKYAISSKTIPVITIILKLGRKPLFLSIIEYSFEARTMITKIIKAKGIPPYIIAKNAVNPIINPVINLITLLLIILS